MDLREQAQLLRDAGAVHGNWYRAQYPDVDALGMRAVEHYLEIGAALGRNPGKHFDTRFYLEITPEAAESGLNPLVHHVLTSSKGPLPRIRRPSPPGLRLRPNRDAERLYLQRFALGFVETPIAALEALVAEGATSPASRMQAAIILAMAAIRLGEEDLCRRAADALAALLPQTASPTVPVWLHARVATALVLLCDRLGAADRAEAVFDAAALAGATDGGLRLAWARHGACPEDRLAWINAALASWGTAGLALQSVSGTAFDRLTPAVEAAPLDGPLVSIILPVAEDPAAVRITLRGLVHQSWRAIEVLLVCRDGQDVPSDAIPQPLVGRIRRLFLPAGSDPANAANFGLAAATGVYVTLLAPGSWSFPDRIAAQVRSLTEHTEAIGCQIEALALTADLAPVTLHPNAEFRLIQTEGCLYRTDRLRDCFGQWDPVARYQDLELATRIETRLGRNALTLAGPGPLALIPAGDPDRPALPPRLFHALLDPVARDYLAAQQAWLGQSETAAPLDPTGARVIPFPAPALSKATAERHYDVVIASDFRLFGGSTLSNQQELLCQNEAGLRTGLLPLHRYDFFNMQRPILPEVIEATVPGLSEVVPRHARIQCDLLLIRYPPVLQHRQDGLPRIEAANTRIIANQPPMSDYTPEGVRRYNFDRCVENLAAMFDVHEAVWHPIGPLLRQAILKHHGSDIGTIRLHDQDWHNIIDLRDWRRPAETGAAQPRRPANRRLRIGRHSRDHFVKWPANRRDILAAYPDDPDTEVHVLGGADTPERIIGYRPRNWTVHPFGTLHPSDFLAGIDVFVYYTHPDWIESFGRSIIEAMAVGVPVILPPDYEILFGDAALYAAPSDAVPLARSLFRDPDAYAAQTARGRARIERDFSYATHLERLGAAGVRAIVSRDPQLRERYR